MKSEVKRIINVCSLSLLGLLCIPVLFYLINLGLINLAYAKRYATGRAGQVVLRKFPYPYQAALSLCSDIDCTETPEEYLTIRNYMQTGDETALGKGLGLNVGGSFFFYEPADRAISYFEYGNAELRQIIVRDLKQGYLDFMHSFGQKFDFTRQDALACLKELQDQGCYLDVWVDHTSSLDNFGDYGTLGYGDKPGTPQYHADLSLAYGFKYAWLGRLTMIAGQSSPLTPSSFTAIHDPAYGKKTVTSIIKEITKHIGAVFGNNEYHMHRDNELVKVVTLEDGQRIFEFTRYDRHPAGVAKGASSEGLAYSIRPQVLDQLIKARGYMVVYTHFAHNYGSSEYLPVKTRQSLENLAAEYHAGRIYVTTTSELLNYYTRHRYLNWSATNTANEVSIQITSVDCPVSGRYVPAAADLANLTFYIPSGKKVTVYAGDTLLTGLRLNPPDYLHRESVTILQPAAAD